MAVNYSNYGYPSGPSHRPPASLPLSSTPSHVRAQRPRFAYSGLPSYPRPRSSASKPNPDNFSTRSKFEVSDGYSDLMRSPFPIDAGYTDAFQGQYTDSQNYPSSPMRYDYRNPPESYIESPMESRYGNASNNCIETPARSKYGNSDIYSDSMINNYGNSNNQADVSYPSIDRDPYSNSNSSVYSQNTTAYYSCSESFYNSPKKPMFPGNAANINCSPAQSSLYSSSKPLFKNPGFGTDSRPDFQGHFQNNTNNIQTNSPSAKPWTKKEALQKKPRKVKKPPMASKSEWRCEVCSIEFTSSIPYDMHLRGAKHAKKLKAQDALQSIQLQVAQSKEIAPLGNSFRCDLCNVMANSSLQLQTHLDGTKHKTKLLQQSKDKKEGNVEAEVNGKSNGAATVRPLPSDFGEPQPSKMCKFSCDICNIVVNSDIQLQQHLMSKKHQATVEGKPLQKKKFKRRKDEEVKSIEEGNTAAGNSAEIGDTAMTEKEDVPVGTTAKEEPTETAEAHKTVVGVKTLSASFVQGGTLQ